MKEITNNLQNDIIKRIQSKEAPTKIIINLLDDYAKDIKDEVDVSELKENALLTYKYFNESYFPKSDEERKEALNSTLSQYIIYNMNLELENIFDKLSLYDKIVIIDDEKYLLKLFGLLYIMNEHYQKLIKYEKLYPTNDVINKATALSTNPKIEDFIVPRINTYKEATKIDNTNKSTQLMLNILVAYKNNPMDIDYSLKQFVQSEKSMYKNINNTLINTLYASRNLLNSSCSIDKEDIFESIQINIFKRYYKYSFLDKCLGIKKRLSHSKISSYTNTLLEVIFNMPESNLKYTRFNQEVQLKTHFDDLEIYEFRTKRNKKLHPFFE